MAPAVCGTIYISSLVRPTGVAPTVLSLGVLQRLAQVQLACRLLNVLVDLHTTQRPFRYWVCAFEVHVSGRGSAHAVQNNSAHGCRGAASRPAARLVTVAQFLNS
jgi:hypothetical protein